MAVNSPIEQREDQTGFTKTSRAERRRESNRRQPLKSKGGAECEQRRIGRDDREGTGARAEKSHGGEPTAR
ncbi:hypothetical protein G5714_021058 [Onychostoma macrolepis]|uniref:Uncharacterized protein n=1 Tax=Onychostoma macrolepis TaxID=369639 RepID=A0A7J6BVN0_9TELE|nr:hypothetical protein G5714_021058 [Onychostoma macrolepis]